MYISIKCKCQLSFDWHLNLIEVYATNSRIIRNLIDPSCKNKYEYRTLYMLYMLCLFVCFDGV